MILCFSVDSSVQQLDCYRHNVGRPMLASTTLPSAICKTIQGTFTVEYQISCWYTSVCNSVIVWDWNLYCTAG